MKYDTSSKEQATKAFEYLTELVGQHEIVEVIKVSPKRSLNQNNYLHLLLGAFGAHFGYSLEEAKHIYKDLNWQAYRYEKKDRLFYKSSADLTKEEMSITIDTFRSASANQGYALPLATDQDWLMQIENTIEQNKRYLST